ncbi:hypothetical protein EVAR_76780_1 [Eumeta japonica]|uniref:Uncharacterized protein n=1 Tax=Eumeta variegata TaxID=151549 RepID=A0A4C1STR7_EUMVA|nr:hypothetical protein EVAR_76780_1 [Eumeta japonica]
MKLKIQLKSLDKEYDLGAEQPCRVDTHAQIGGRSIGAPGDGRSHEALLCTLTLRVSTVERATPTLPVSILMDSMRVTRARKINTGEEENETLVSESSRPSETVEYVIDAYMRPRHE